MKRPERLVGFVSYEEYTFPFEFDEREFKVNLYPPNREVWRRYSSGALTLERLQQTIESSNEWISNRELSGRTSEGYRITFWVSNNYSSYHGFLASLLLGILFGKKDIQVKQLMVFVYEDQKLMRSFLRNQCLNMTFNQQKTVSGLRRLLYQQNAKMRWTEASFFFQTVSLLKLNFIPMHLLCEHRIP